MCGVCEYMWNVSVIRLYECAYMIWVCVHVPACDCASAFVRGERVRMSMGPRAVSALLRLYVAGVSILCLWLCLFYFICVCGSCLCCCVCYCVCVWFMSIWCLCGPCVYLVSVVCVLLCLCCVYVWFVCLTVSVYGFCVCMNPYYSV